MLIKYILLSLPGLVLIAVLLRQLSSFGRQAPSAQHKLANSHFQAFLDEYADKQKGREKLRREQ